MSSQNAKTTSTHAQVSLQPQFEWFTAEAREVLAHRHYHPMMCIAKGREIPEPSDAASNAVLRALQSFDPDKGRFIGLARKALEFEIFNQRRHISRHPVPEELPEDFDMESPEVHHFRDGVELDRVITKFWVKLNRVDQRLLWLRMVGGFSFPEIEMQKRFIGCPMKQVTMRTRFTRAIRKLPNLRKSFDDIEFCDFVDSIHRVARACGTLDITKEEPKRKIRSVARRNAAQKRCKTHPKRAMGS